MARSSHKSRCVVVYSSQPDGGVLYRTTLAEATEQVKLGNAVEVKSAHASEYAIQLTALNRSGNLLAPSGITAREMRAATEGSARAREKVRVWGLLQRRNFARLVVSA